MAGQTNFNVGRKRGLSLADRLDRLSIPEPMSGCVLWMGAWSVDGYGHVKVDGGVKVAHRVAWEIVNGPIPAGMELDHICRVRSCINLAHLRMVTHRENVLYGDGLAAIAARKTACPEGHPYDVVSNRGGRYCRRCHNEMNVRNRAKAKARMAVACG